MAKNLKLKIKNEQIAAAVSLGGLKEKLAKKKAEASAAAEPAAAVEPPKEVKATTKAKAKKPSTPTPTSAPVSADASETKAPRVRARTRSAFAEPDEAQMSEVSGEHFVESASSVPIQDEEIPSIEIYDVMEEDYPENVETVKEATIEAAQELPIEESVTEQPKAEEVIPPPVVQREAPVPVMIARRDPITRHAPVFTAPPERLGPTGRHVRDLLPKVKPRVEPARQQPSVPNVPTRDTGDKTAKPVKAKEAVTETEESEEAKKKSGKFKEYRDIKPTRTRTDAPTNFDSRARQGLRVDEEQQHWRRRRNKASRQQVEAPVRPTNLKVRIPITLKDLAGELKLKASQLIEKLFLQGIIATINDYLDDATSIQLLGEEFGCQITIDTSEEERIRITDKTIKEEISGAGSDDLCLRPPVVTFMGHVDHGKTSLIDVIRQTNRAAGEAGAITQHIGAFQCHTAIGNLTVIDTPGHEAFSAMRARGADVTDIVVLVIAGDEGIRAQTIEAINHAKTAGVTIVVALNKCDKPNFNAENVYRQLAEQDLLPEAWGGQIITVNCSAVTGEGITPLLEMLALQAEVLELRANPTSRARGAVIEVEMHKGLGATASVLVQNGTLRRGDAIVFGQFWGRVKTMRDDTGKEVKEAGPSAPVEITGLSGLPAAGQEFIVVANEREARDISEKRAQEHQKTRLQQAKPITMEGLFQKAAEVSKKVLTVVLRADVRGALEAMIVALQKIQSSKVDLNIIFSGVGEISESDVQLAATSGAIILGFHTQIESHADALVKQLGVKVRQHDVIFHAIDDMKVLMTGLLDKIEQENDKGKAEIKAIFKSSQLGNIAGCQVTEGSIFRNNRIRVMRNGEQIWKGGISSLRRINDDVREVTKGLECGIVLSGFQTPQVGDILEAYEVIYITQEL